MGVVKGFLQPFEFVRNIQKRGAVLRKAPLILYISPKFYVVVGTFVEA